MAVEQTLADRIAASTNRKKRLVRGPDGQLQEMTGEDIQSIASDQGQQLPTSPMQAAVLGASPDSAKMIGDARQKRAALDINQQTAPQTQTLTDKLRTNIGRMPTEGSVATREQMPISESMRNLGSLGSRVHDMIVGSVSKPGLLQQGISSTSTAATAGLSSEASGALNAYIASPTPENSAAFSAATGGADPAQYLGSAGTDVAAMGRELAGGVTDANQITVGSMDLTTMVDDSGKPLFNPGELASSLGVTEDELKGMSLQQLQANIQQLVATNTQDMEQWQSRATDPNLGPAERAEARQQLRDMGAIGVRANEAEWDELGAAMDSADEIQFGGQSYTVDELLSDDGITNLVSDYINNPARAAELSKSAPELTKWIEDHRAALTDATEELADTTNRMNETTAANTELAQGLPTEVMSALVPGYDPESTIAIDPASLPPAARILQDTTLGPILTGALTQYPELASELSGMSEEQIRASGILEPTSDRWQSYIRARQDYSRVQDATSTEQLIDAIFGVDVDQADVDTALLNAYRESKTGLGDPYATNTSLLLLDPDRDGHIGSKKDKDTLGVLKGQILGNRERGFGSAEIPKLGTEVRNPMESLGTTLTKSDSTFSRLSDILGKGLLDSDGKHLDLDSKDMTKLVKKATIADLLELQKKGSGSGNVLGIDSSEKKQLTAAINDRIDSELDDVYKKFKYKPSKLDKLNKKELKLAKMDIEVMITQAKSDGRSYLVSKLEKQLDAISDARKKLNDGEYELSSDPNYKPTLSTGSASVSTKQLSKKEAKKLEAGYKESSGGELVQEDITGYTSPTEDVLYSTGNDIGDDLSESSGKSKSKSSKSSSKSKSKNSKNKKK